jgi:hypothetical protein
VGLHFEKVLVRIRYKQIVESALEVLDEQYVETVFVHRDCLLLSSSMVIAIAWHIVYPYSQCNRILV